MPNYKQKEISKRTIMHRDGPQCYIIQSPVKDSPLRNVVEYLTLLTVTFHFHYFIYIPYLQLTVVLYFSTAEPEPEPEAPPAPAPTKGRRGRKPKKVSVEHW